MRKRRNLFFCLLVASVAATDLFGQCLPCTDPNFPIPDGIVDYNAARISMLGGSHVEFNFNTISDYKCGLVLSNASIIGITICNCPQSEGLPSPPNENEVGTTLVKWELYFDSNDGNIAGQGGGSLPLCVIEAEASTRIGMGGTVIYNGRQPLDVQGAPPTPIAEEDTDPASPSRAWNMDQMNITYYCGVPSNWPPCGVGVPVTNANCAGLQDFPFINDPPEGDMYIINASFTLVPIFNGGSFDPFY